jgi:glutamine phosphoribosylpyrophosphate amidotransferase
LDISWPFFFGKQSEIAHFKGYKKNKKKKNTKKYEKNTATLFEVIFFARVDLMWNNSMIDILLFS